MTDAEKIKAFAKNMKIRNAGSDIEIAKLCDMVIEMADCLHIYRHYKAKKKLPSGNALEWHFAGDLLTKLAEELK